MAARASQDRSSDLLTLILISDAPLTPAVRLRIPARRRDLGGPTTTILTFTEIYL